MIRMFIKCFLVMAAMMTAFQGFADNNWLLSVGGGAQRTSFSGDMMVNNGLDLAIPYNNDRYLIANTTQGIVMLTAGYRWQREAMWMPAWSTGIAYQYLLNSKAGGTIQQYSLPEFTNYHYQRELSSNVALVTAKLNIFQYAMVSPWINTGIGAAFNRSGHYQESALANVTPRISPNFATHTTSQFAWNVGVGVDVIMSARWFVSVGFDWQDLGAVASGVGQQLWSSQALQTDSYRAAQVIASINYLF